MNPSFYPPREDFLHFIWMNQYFDKDNLCLFGGDSLQVIHPGFHNHDSGPDFSEAIIKINGLEWRGQVEIHIKSSHWLDHGHTSDAAYDSVILHVVWENDCTIRRSNKSVIPALELKNKVSPSLISNFRGLQNLLKTPCSNSFGNISEITKLSMCELAAVERIEQKVSEVTALMISTVNHWESIALRWLLSSLGFNKNHSHFLVLGRAIPWKKWPALSLFQKEALAFGLAGFLETVRDNYSEKLKKEYLFLKYKWNLTSPLHSHNWKFMRMRPAQFPTLRLAQFCSLTHGADSFFQKILNAGNKNDLLKLFECETSEYWKEHYHFLRVTSKKTGGLGAETVYKLIINFVTPLLFAYADYRDDETLKIKGLHILESLPPEKNSIVNHWKQLGYIPENALETQGLIQLNNFYCKLNRCLECRIGKELLVSQ